MNESSTGRYLSPEPLLQKPDWVASELQSGHQVPAYSYARNNPVGTTDPTGLAPPPTPSRNPYGGGCNLSTDVCSPPKGCVPAKEFPVSNIENPGRSMSVPIAYNFCLRNGVRDASYVMYEQLPVVGTGWRVICYTCDIPRVISCGGPQ